MKNPKHLSYLQDIPLNDNQQNKIDVNGDKFRHQGYVDALHNMAVECPERFCIGLFGGWGSGKTGIVKGLEKKIIDLKDKSEVKLLYFNVWKYSDDSLRRQLLLKIDKEWFAGKLDHAKKLYIDTKQDTTITSGFSWKLFFRWDRLLFLFGSLLIIFIVAFFQGQNGLYGKNFIEILGTAIIPVFIIAITAIQGKETITKIFEDSNKPTSPEEFEKLFQKALNEPAIKNKRKVFILDDLDRCENEKVLEVLAGLSTFLDEKNCIYIIPCDDRRIKSHIRKSLNNSGESNTLEESDFLKKLFHANINLRPTADEHLEEYIEDLLKKTGIVGDGEIRDLQTVLQVGLSKNPRRIKQFINNLVAGYNLAIELETEGSLTAGVITEHLGFLAKVLFIRDYFPNAFEYFETNPGSFKEVELWIGEHQRDASSLNRSRADILNEDADGITLRRFIDATGGLTDQYSDIFFRFSGKKDIIEVELISNIISAAEGKNMPELERLLKETLVNASMVIKLKGEIITRIKAVNKSHHLRTNLVTSFININETFLNEELMFLTGSIVEHTPDDIIANINRDLSPIIWELAAKKVFSHEKIQAIGNVAFSFMDNNYKENVVELGNRWNQDSAHLKKINTHWLLLNHSLQKPLTDLVRRIIEVEIRTQQFPNSDFWNWMLPDEKGEPVQIIYYPDALKQICEAIKGDKINRNIEKAGLLVAKLSHLTGTDVLSQMINRIIPLFQNPFIVGENFAPEVVQNWVLVSNQKFDSVTAANIFEKLLEWEADWNNSGYTMQKSWLPGLIELYPKLSQLYQKKIRVILESQIEVNFLLYEEHYAKTKFQKDHQLNFTAIQALAYSNKLNYTENELEWKKRLNIVFKEVFELNVADIFNVFFKPLWRSHNAHAFNLSTLGIEILSENHDQLDDPKMLVEVGFNSILDRSFWINMNKEWKERFVQAHNVIFDSVGITQKSKDDLIKVWMTKFIALDDESFKLEQESIRGVLYSKLSPLVKEECLNQIWTRNKSNVKKDLDIEFLINNFTDLKTSDKQEVFDELFEQLNTVE